MISFLDGLDKSLFLLLNQLHHPKLDPIMLAISYSESLLVILLLALFSYGFYKLKKTFFLAIFFSLLAFGVSDRVTSGIFKPGFERLRPCHSKDLKKKVHLAEDYCGGGKFGFVSSHASNSFAIALFFFLLFRRTNKYMILLFLYAGLVSYSRIYLARHYPGDIFFGALFGLMCGFIFYKLYELSIKRLKASK